MEYFSLITYLFTKKQLQYLSYAEKEKLWSRCDIFKNEKYFITTIKQFFKGKNEDKGENEKGSPELFCISEPYAVICILFMLPENDRFEFANKWFSSTESLIREQEMIKKRFQNLPLEEKFLLLDSFFSVKSGFLLDKKYETCLSGVF